MKRIIRLTESDLARIVKKVISERNVLSEEYLLVSVPENYDNANKNGKKWMNGLIGVIEPTFVKDEKGQSSVQQGFYDDASKNNKLKVSGFIKTGKYPFIFKGGKAIVQTPKFSFTLESITPDQITEVIDSITPKQAAQKGYKYYFVVENTGGAGGSGIYRWVSSSGKRFNSYEYGGHDRISNVSFGSSTEP
jgi:hypothetical protein